MDNFIYFCTHAFFNDPPYMSYRAHEIRASFRGKSKLSFYRRFIRAPAIAPRIPTFIPSAHTSDEIVSRVLSPDGKIRAFSSSRIGESGLLRCRAIEQAE